MKRRRLPPNRARGRNTGLPQVWLARHVQGALGALGRLFRAPLATLLTVSVVGIALALPAGLYVLTRNLSLLGEGWEQTASISLFLRQEVDLQRATELAAKLFERDDLDDARVIDPEAALEELRNYGGFAEAIDQLDENPLPVVLALRPAGDSVPPQALARLRDELSSLPEADFARLDAEWIRRFQSIVSVAQRGVLILSGVLGLAVLLVVGNTIRLEIENRRSEIEIMELVGATPAFIRRPFLYTGAWYGGFAGLTAWLLVSLALALMDGPVTRLAALYRTEFPLAGLDPAALFVLLGASVALGLLGSRLSVGRHLTTHEPG